VPRFLPVPVNGSEFRVTVKLWKNTKSR